MRRQIGFTLLEVLVALAVLAIAMGAIIGVATQSVNNFGTLRDQTFAGWAALNKVNELLLHRDPWPMEGSRKGAVELANRRWRWEARFQKTDDPDLTRLEVTVRLSEDGSALSTLTAFKSRPPPDEPTADQPTADESPVDQPPQDQPATDQAPPVRPRGTRPHPQ